MKILEGLIYSAALFFFVMMIDRALGWKLELGYISLAILVVPIGSKLAGRE
jgi:hypothetical protein